MKTTTSYKVMYRLEGQCGWWEFNSGLSFNEASTTARELRNGWASLDEPREIGVIRETQTIVLAFKTKGRR